MELLFLAAQPECRCSDGIGGFAAIYTNISALTLPVLFPRLAALGVGPVAGLGQAVGLPATSYGKLYMAIGRADGNISVERVMMVPF